MLFSNEKNAKNTIDVVVFKGEDDEEEEDSNK